MDGAYDIDIHLSPSRPPDPTTWTDYVVVALLIAIVLGFAYFARAIHLLTVRWPILKWINVPLLIAMSVFSCVHLAAVFLTESYFEPLTAAVRAQSCVLVPFWMEYVVGLGGFSAMLVLRLVSFCMIMFPVCFTENHRMRLALRASVIACTHGPLVVICALVTWENGSLEVAAPYPHCATRIEYRVAVVVWLLYVLCVIVGLTIAVRNAVVAKMEIEVVVDVVKVSVSMLLLGCMLHFLYLLSFWWGRFLFMLMVCVLHTYAYYRYVLPVWVEYMVHGTDEARKASAARMAQMCGPVEFVLQSSLKVTPKSLLTIQELRKSFFEYIRTRENIYANVRTMTVLHGEALERLGVGAEDKDTDKFGDVEEYHDIGKVLHYYDILRQLAEFDGVDEKVPTRYQKVCKLHSKLVQVHLTPGGGEYLHMDNGTRNALIYAVADPDENKWDFCIFSQTAKRVATMLCDALSAQYTNAEYGTILRIQEERSRQLRTMHFLGLYAHQTTMDTTVFVSETEEYAGVLSALARCFRAPTKSREEIEMEVLLSGAEAERAEGERPYDDKCESLSFKDGGQFEDSMYTIELDD